MAKVKLPQTIEFYGASVTVTKDVLFPRPETEFLVERADKILEKMRLNKIPKLHILDIGTGSGAIFIPLAKKFPDEGFVGADLSKKALAIARKNARANNVKNVKLIRSNLFKNITGRFDLIIANLPYVETKNMPKKLTEPKIALHGGQNGLEVIEKFLKDAGKFLKRDGAILMEIGTAQGKAVKKLVQKYLPAKKPKLESDYAGHDRYLQID